MRVLALTNLKGGVGKSLLVANLATRSAANGLNTLVVDLDTSVPVQALCLSPEPGQHGLQEVSEKLKLWSGTDWDRINVRTLWPEAELVIVDTGPRADAAFQLAVQSADLCGVVIGPDPQSMLGAVRTVRAIRMLSGATEIGSLCNRFASKGSSAKAAARFSSTCSRFVSARTKHLGCVVETASLGLSWSRQTTVSTTKGSKVLLASLDSILEAVAYPPDVSTPEGILESLRTGQAADIRLAA